MKLCSTFLFLNIVSVLSDLLNLEEGSKCMRNNVPGECVSMYKCFGHILDIQNQDFAPICSFRGNEAIICCTDCELVDDIRNIVLDYNLGQLNKTGHKAHDKCVEYLSTIKYPCKMTHGTNVVRKLQPEAKCHKINIYHFKYGFSYNGVNARRAQYPHMALLGYGDDYTSVNWLCGGTVISEKFILTAGHCLSTPKLGQVNFVALGILKRSDPPELWQVYKVKNIFPYPEYRPPSKYHDIALLETETTIKFNDQVRPACLHTQGENLKQLYATGWGALGPRSPLADTLQAVTVNRFEEVECGKYYPKHRLLQYGYNHTTQMCYGDKINSSDTCQGDSGGPLQSSSYQIYNCVDTVVGVTSSGRTCGLFDGPGIYTRVIYYIPWIESIVWP